MKPRNYILVPVPAFPWPTKPSWIPKSYLFQSGLFHHHSSSGSTSRYCWSVSHSRIMLIAWDSDHIRSCCLRTGCGLFEILGLLWLYNLSLVNKSANKSCSFTIPQLPSPVPGKSAFICEWIFLRPLGSLTRKSLIYPRLQASLGWHCGIHSQAITLGNKKSLYPGLLEEHINCIGQICISECVC